MIKSKLRDKVLKLRKSNPKKSININPSNIYSYLKKKKYNLKIIGGYYPTNYEINDLQILSYFFKIGTNFRLSDINGPIKIAKIIVPRPKVPPKSQPKKTTKNSMLKRMRLIGFL